MTDEPVELPEEGPPAEADPPVPSTPETARLQRPSPRGTRPVEPPGSKVRRTPTYDVIDPRHGQAEAEARGWGLGVVSLTADELVLDQEQDLEPQVVDMTDRALVRDPSGLLHIVWADSMDDLLEDGA